LFLPFLPLLETSSSNEESSSSLEEYVLAFLTFALSLLFSALSMFWLVEVVYDTSPGTTTRAACGDLLMEGLRH
jgi:hypothetical protein